MNIFNKIAICSAICLMFNVKCNAQYIVDVQHQPNGSRLIMTHSKNFFWGEAHYFISLDAVTIDNTQKWILRIDSQEELDTNSEILFKSANDQLIFIPVNSIQVGKDIRPGVSFIENTLFGPVAITYPSIAINHYYGSFVIDEKDLNNLMDNGISKIRLYTGKYYEEVVKPPKRFRKLLIKCYTRINKHVNKFPDTKNIFDKF